MDGSWIRRLSIVNMPILPKLVYWLDAIQIKIQEIFFVGIDKLGACGWLGQ